MIFRSLIRNDVGSLDPRGTGVEVVKFPGRQRAVAGDATLDFDDACRPEIRPGEFFLAGPNDFHWTTRGARQPSSLDRRVASVFPSIRGSRVRHNHAHVTFRQMKNSRKLIAVGERALRPSPHREFSIGPLSYSRARLQRSVRDVRNGVARV